jgi:hypothetical protein
MDRGCRAIVLCAAQCTESWADMSQLCGVGVVRWGEGSHWLFKPIPEKQCCCLGSHIAEVTSIAWLRQATHARYSVFVCILATCKR